MEPDQKLLRRYAETGDETAFAEVVCRHTDLVYTAALRLMAGDTHLAQDVAQQVFTAMANKAAALSHHASLAGWLHTTTRYAASVAVRSERRRQTREHEASTMEHQPTATEADWMQLEPMLDEAVGQLRTTDREAVLLRYFQGKSHREVGEALGWNESLAQKRVERSLDQLRTYFTRRGVMLSSVVLATSMTANSVQAAPLGLAANLAGASLAGVTKASVVGTLLKGISISMRTKTTLAAIAMIGLVAAPIVESRQISQTESRNADLNTQNADLQAQINRLSMRLRKIKNVLVDPALKQSIDPNDYLLLSKETIQSLEFGPRNGSFQLDSQSIGLLAMSPIEASKVQDVLTTLKSRIDDHSRMTVHLVPAGQVTDEDVLNFQKDYPGRQTVYAIPPLSPDEEAAQRQWLQDGLTNALGDERGIILFQKILEANASPYWLRQGMRKTYAFSDSEPAPGETSKSVGEVFAHDDTGVAPGISVGYLFNDVEGFHPEESYFVKALRAGVRPPPPPPEPSPQYKAVADNLVRLWTMAENGYMDEHNVSEVSYAQLIADPKFNLDIKSVVGENYNGLVFRKGEPVTLQVPGIGQITIPKQKSP